MRKHIFIIAEAGVNHNGSLLLAKKLVNIAAKAGADAVKFQTFRAEDLVLSNAPQAKYQQCNTGKTEWQFDMLKRLELSEASHRSLIKHCKKRGIKFLSTPFDIKSILLLRRLGLKTFKIPSGEITNIPYLRFLGRLKVKIILSTGMSDLTEVKIALRTIINAGTPRKNITVLHCTSSYPAPYAEVNLHAMETLRRELGTTVGYSDHTQGIEIPIAAAALGAQVIEKHFTFSRSLPGPDHKASLEPSELTSMILALRNVECALGNGVKNPSSSELKNIKVARKSIVASRDIQKGEVFDGSNLTVKRPGNGLSPLLWDKVLGKRAKYNFKKDDMVKA